MTGTVHEVWGSDKSVDGRAVVLPSTSPNELRGDCVLSLKRGARGGIKSKEKLRHG